MTKIIKIPETLVSKIAAGEVIERPAYVVKEIVENSLDAGAKTISINIEDSGFKKITVTDDGEGMSREDAILSVQRFTTSKLKNDDMLFSITTLGFRGEALASIAAVSAMTITTKQKNKLTGTYLEMEYGEVKKTTNIGAKNGTTITVQNLFNNVPARKKFLKTKKTEFKLIVDLITPFALSHPKLKLSLRHNNKLIFNFTENQNLEERLETIIGPEIFENLLPIKVDDTYIKISGFVAKPQSSSLSQNKQYIFVNKRKVTDKVVAHSVKDAFGSLIDDKAYPPFLLFIDLPFEMVDVNIHPKKSEISFSDQKTVFDTINGTVKQLLLDNNLTFNNLSWKENLIKSRNTNSHVAKKLKRNVIDTELKKLNNNFVSKNIKQIHNLYLITETQEGMVIIDQHAAHERILYEKLLVGFKKEKEITKSINLEKPITFKLSITDSEELISSKDKFFDLGFKFEKLKQNTFRLISIPEMFKDRDSTKIISEILDTDPDMANLSEVDTISNKMLTYIACRSAIKSGDNLNEKQTKTLLQELATCPNNYTCPHGRPTRVELSLTELNKIFKRE